mmetsp:Transcript_16783/g.32700  ORF Transcript_16783/g.32700 Transcript_16783/m.32700 type:complete len:225 (-) Transcript_16783:1874-2548(-)
MILFPDSSSLKGAAMASDDSFLSKLKTLRRTCSFLESLIWTRSSNSAPVIAKFGLGLPSEAKSRSRRIPHCFAIAIAVVSASPVHIRTSIPAALHFSMDLGTDSRKGSSIPTSATRVRSCSRASVFDDQPPLGASLKSRKASASVRIPACWYSSIVSLNSLRVLSSSFLVEKRSFSWIARFEQTSIIWAGAPFVKSLYFAPSLEDDFTCTTQDIIFRSELKGIE